MRDREGRRARSVAAWLLALAATVVVVAGPRPASASVAPAHFQNAPIASWRLDGVGWTTAISGGTLYVGGQFTTVTSPDGTMAFPRANLAAFDLQTGAILPAFRADTNGAVRALAVDGSRLYVGGSFTQVAGTSRSRLAAVDATTGALVAGWAPSANSNVYALVASGTRLYVGGSFSTIAGTARSRAAALNLADGSLTSFAPTFDSTVNALAVAPDGALYAGGGFTKVNGTTSTWMARVTSAGALDPVAWTLAGPPSDIEVDATGTRVAVSETGVGNQGTWLDAASGRALWHQRCDGDAQAIHIVDGSVFTGFHEACDGDTTQRLAGNDSDDGSRDYDLHPTFDRFWGIRALDGDANRLVVAGDFNLVGGVAVSGFAILPALAVPASPITVRGGASWRYQDGTAPVPAGWQQPGFDDRAWPSGRAQLGYGDGDEATVLPTGALGSKPITSYYRTTFDATELPATLTLRLVADDGAVVYVNGVEVVRDNMPSGTITSSTRAASGRSGTAENQVRTFALAPSAVVVGTNTIAVEVHQDAPSSSDLSFLAALASTAVPATTTTTTEATTTTSSTTTVDPTTTTTIDPTTTTSVDPTTTTTTLDPTTTTTTLDPTTTTTTLDPTTTTTSVDPTTTTTTLDPTTTTTIADPTTTTTTLDPTTTTTTLDPTTTTTAPTTTTTAAPTTTTTTVPPPPPPLYQEGFGLADGSAWPGWSTSAASGSIAVDAGTGRLAVDDVANAYARAQLTSLVPVTDSDTTLSYQWSSTSAAATFNLYVRGSGGWLNAYRPRTGYGIEVASNSGTAYLRKVVNGTTTTVLTVTGAQPITTGKRWVRVRVVGSTVQFKVWADGQAQPAAWAGSITDAGVAGSGTIFTSIVRNGANVGAKAVRIDDVRIDAP
ncbi:MAG: hypothetical protein U0P45_16320 [Acidimicrobiales bacterium]